MPASSPHVVLESLSPVLHVHQAVLLDILLHDDSLLDVLHHGHLPVSKQHKQLPPYHAWCPQSAFVLFQIDKKEDEDGYQGW